MPALGNSNILVLLSSDEPRNMHSAFIPYYLNIYGSEPGNLLARHTTGNRNDNARLLYFPKIHPLLCFATETVETNIHIIDTKKRDMANVTGCNLITVLHFIVT